MTNFRDIYKRHSQDVYRFCFWLTGDHHEAEDLTSETFVRVWASADSLRLPTVKAYLLTIAKNLYLNTRRRSQPQVRLHEGRKLATRSLDPEQRASGRAELEEVLRALDRLSEVDRAALLMRAVEQLPYDEIAQALKVSPVAARVRVHRARRRLLNITEERRRKR